VELYSQTSSQEVWLQKYTVTVLVLAQVIRPKRHNPDVVPSMTIDAVQSVPADVHAVFEHSCKDCHSNDTRWLWYSVVGPVSWLIAHDVNRGREN
jgi:hypothetical protein